MPDRRSFGGDPILLFPIHVLSCGELTIGALITNLLNYLQNLVPLHARPSVSPITASGINDFLKIFSAFGISGDSRVVG